jgi:hypothetical protein
MVGFLNMALEAIQRQLNKQNIIPCLWLGMSIMYIQSEHIIACGWGRRWLTLRTTNYFERMSPIWEKSRILVYLGRALFLIDKSNDAVLLRSTRVSLSNASPYCPSTTIFMDMMNSHQHLRSQTPSTALSLVAT